MKPRARASTSRVSFSVVALLMVGVFLVQGCTVARNMRVRSGNDPRYQDEEVRFRTTYYFRVFDACEGIGELETDNQFRNDTVFGGKIKGPYTLRTDSLYRFRMTGKANSLFQQIQFESGTLRKEEIDPFGSNVAFDSKTNRFVYRSREESQSEARREARFADIERLRALRDSFDAVKEAPARQEVDTIIQNQIRALAPADVVANTPRPAPGAAPAVPAVPAPAIACPGGTPARRGFQILGPEGWRTFDQDERLLMAMASSARPLTSTLQQLSRNVLNAQQIPSEALLPLVRERLRIVETLNVVKPYESAPGDVDQMIRELLATFNKDSGAGGAR